MNGESRFPTRMGDGELVQMTRSEIRADLEAGVEVAVRRAKVPPLAEDELDHLLDIYASPARFTGVDIGSEVVLSFDGSGMKTIASRREDLQIYEQWFGADTIELHHVDYSFKPVKAIVPFEAQEMHDVLLRVVAPVQYGSQPNLGPLLAGRTARCPTGRSCCRRVVSPRRAPPRKKRCRWPSRTWSTTAKPCGRPAPTASTSTPRRRPADADFQATLLAVEEVRRRCPGLGIEVGMSGEFVLGMHGEVEYDGVRLAGLWPADQMKLADKGRATVSARSSTSTPASPAPGTSPAPARS